MSAPLNFTICSAIQITEQVNGFYLISLQLQEKPQLKNLIGKIFKLSIQQAQLDICLLQMPSEFNKTYQFLTIKPLPESETLPNKLDDFADLVLEEQSQSKEATMLPAAEKPCIICASNRFLANAFALAKTRQNIKVQTIVLMEAELFPFMPKPARFWSPEMPDEAIAASSLLEDWNIINRLASKEMLPGCFHGNVNELFKEWQQNMQSMDEWQIINLH